MLHITQPTCRITWKYFLQRIKGCTTWWKASEETPHWSLQTAVELNNHVLSRNKCHTRRRHITVVNSVLTALLSRILITPTLSSTRHHYTLTVIQDSPGSLWTGRWTTTSPHTFKGNNNRPRYRYLLTSLQAGRCPVNLTTVKTLMLNSLRNLYLF